MSGEPPADLGLLHARLGEAEQGAAERVRLRRLRRRDSRDSRTVPNQQERDITAKAGVDVDRAGELSSR
jgi:hypothetical protein